MKIFIKIILIILVVKFGYSQSLELKGIYDFDDFYRHELIYESTSDSNFAYTAGILESDTNNGVQWELLWIAKWNNDGDLISSIKISIDNYYPTNILINSQNNLVVSAHGSSNSAIIILDKDLNILNNKFYSFFSWDMTENLKDGGYISVYEDDLYFIGEDLEFQKMIDVGNCSYDFAQIRSSDNEIILLGNNLGCPSTPDSNLVDAEKGRQDIILIKMGYEGNIIWAKNFGSSKKDNVFVIPKTRFDLPRKDRLILDNNSDIYFTLKTDGNDKDFEFNDENISAPTIIMKTNKDGDIIWKKFMDRKTSNFIYAFYDLEDKLLFSAENLTNYTNDGLGCGNCEFKYANVRVISKSDGSTLGEYTLDGPEDDYVSSIVNINSQLVIFGNTRSTDEEGNIFFISEDTDGLDLFVATLQLNQTTSNEEVFIIGLKAFPNPANDQIYLSENIKYFVFSNKGELVKKGNGSEVNISDLIPGNYFLNTTRGTIQFIKQ